MKITTQEQFEDWYKNEADESDKRRLQSLVLEAMSKQATTVKHPYTVECHLKTDKK